MATQKLISIKQMTDLLNRNRRTLHVWVRDGKFPEPLKMNGRTVGWPESVYHQWLSEQMEVGK
ncbi:AlpA family transcriptional regulator [Vibrio diazotrophicus]|uniref:AlpA family transcriptional regulator n=1 Tax=Vibrio diazotrophicus TaxID=685 RepID=A0A329DVY9_VIBDI|nr:AlpA family phage regulatory protein [Vibrio diazotrophicus]RAS54415.1 AlpA family transcriptional regulator [Vibrio diazotrophicus]